MKLSQLGEFGLIDKLSKIIGKTLGSVVLGIGDDCAAIQISRIKNKKLKTQTEKQKYILITTDTLIENIHFKTKGLSFFDLGYKALAINISDIAAMGGVPTYALVAIGADRDLPVRKIEQLYRGIKKAAEKFKIQIVGGDTVQSRDLVVSVTLLGEVEKKCLLTRSGAKVGDAILVTGSFGDPAASHYTLRATPNLARLREAGAIARSGLCSSMIDSSDGLIRSVREICKASKVGARVNLDSIPVAKGASIEQALYGGEEYELVFTAPKSRAVKLQDLVQKKTRTRVSILGEIVSKKRGLKLVDIQGKVLSPRGGYEHFR